MPDSITLPLQLQIPLGGLILASLSWLILEAVGRRFRPGSMLRGLLLTSRLSVAATCVIAGLGWWLAMLLDPVVINLQRDGQEVRELLVALGLSWTLLRWRQNIRHKHDAYSTEVLPRLSEQERHFLFDVLQKIISIAAWVVVAYAFMNALGVSAAVLITAGGFGAAAVGFGAQGIVSNSLSGLSLYINRPFIIDDFIEIPAQNLMGTVENISWFYTKLRTPDRQPVYVPNTIFTSSPVINTAAIDNRRIWIEFGLNYNDRPKIPAIVNELQTVLSEQPMLDRSKTTVVHFTGYGESSLDLRLICHANSSAILDAWAVQQHLLLTIGDVVERHGASMPFPTRTLIQARDAADRP
jgi:MscS family membrane protein